MNNTTEIRLYYCIYCIILYYLLYSILYCLTLVETNSMVSGTRAYTRSFSALPAAAVVSRLRCCSLLPPAPISPRLDPAGRRRLEVLLRVVRQLLRAGVHAQQQ